MTNLSFIAKLLKQEDVNIEFKSKFELSNILKTICAFLNTDGGWVLVGYSNKKIFGIPSNVEELISELEESVLNIILPQPLVYINEEEYKGKKLILINVLKGSRQPYSLDSNYFVRKGSSTISANSDDISLLLRTSKIHTSTWEKMNVTDASLSDLQNKEIEKTITESNIKGRGESLPNTIEEFLAYFQMMDFSFISNGAMLLFGKEPVKYIPQCRIRITVMPYGKTGDTYSDTLLIEDNLFISFKRTVDYFTKNLPLINDFDPDSGHRVAMPKYPNLALREAIVNAIVHRDYADYSGDITINIYSDNVEIINSGEIPSNIITDNKINPHHSVLRNPTIAHMFYLRGNMEKIGRGLSLIKKQFSEEGYKAPEWTSENGYTTLRLYTVSEKLNDRMNSFLNQLKKGSKFRRQDYVDYFSSNISEKTARNDISVLVSSKYLIVEGKGPSTKYKRTNKELPNITR